MSLKVKDIIQLQTLQSFKLVAGVGGLERYVGSVGIADYEFAPNIEYEKQNAFVSESFIISSLLFAKDKPELLLDAVKRLHKLGTSGLAFKTIIYKELPQEVIEYCNKNDYPIFSFDTNTFFEYIIYEIMDAVQRDDSDLFSESNIYHMLQRELNRDEIQRICKSASLIFHKFACVVYIVAKPGQNKAVLENSLRKFYIFRNICTNALLCRYREGFFVILTGTKEQLKDFAIILQQLLGALGIDENTISTCFSLVHKPFEELDLCFRESYHSYLASLVTGQNFRSYSEIGVFKFLISNLANEDMQRYSDEIINVLESEKLLATAEIFALCEGDILTTAAKCGCHANTIRYRLSKMKELLHCEDKSEAELYLNLSIALKFNLLQKLENK